MRKLGRIVKTGANSIFGGVAGAHTGISARLDALGPKDIKKMRGEIVVCTQIVWLLRQGVLLLDEVDLILHPLKSELNWPLGAKMPLDLTLRTLGGNGRATLEAGIRWQIPFHLLDALFFKETGRSVTLSLRQSRAAQALLVDIKEALDAGLERRLLQVSYRRR